MGENLTSIFSQRNPFPKTTEIKTSFSSISSQLKQKLKQQKVTQLFEKIHKQNELKKKDQRIIMERIDDQEVISLSISEEENKGLHNKQKSQNIKRISISDSLKFQESILTIEKPSKNKDEERRKREITFNEQEQERLRKMQEIAETIKQL